MSLVQIHSPEKQNVGRRSSLAILYERWWKAARRGKRRHGRRPTGRGLCWGLLLFPLVQWGVVLAMDWHRPGFRDPGYQSNLDYLRQRQRELPGAPVVVVLGSSRCQYALHWETMERLASEGDPAVVAGFAQCGAGPMTQLMTLLHLLKDGVKPDLVLVEALSLRMPASRLMEMEMAFTLPESSWRIEDYSFLRRRALTDPFTVQNNRACLCLFPCYFYRTALTCIFVPRLLHEDDYYQQCANKINRGFFQPLPQDISEDKREKLLAKAMVESHNTLTRLSTKGPSWEAFQDILQLGQDQGIPMVVVFFPEGPKFQSFYPPGAWEVFAGEVGTLGQRHEAPVLNTRTWMKEEDFFDSHHLYRTGAEKFTKRLWRESLEPQLRALRGQISAPPPPIE